jgi:hypothetical protein
MNTLSTIDRIITATRLNTVLGHLGNRLLPSLDAEAGVIDCSYTSYGACGSCKLGVNWGVRWTSYWASSDTCSQGWPVCNCNWTQTGTGCNPC